MGSRKLMRDYNIEFRNMEKEIADLEEEAKTVILIVAMATSSITVVGNANLLRRSKIHPSYDIKS